MSASVEVQRHLGVTELFAKSINERPEAVAQLDQKLDREAADIRNEMRRGFCRPGLLLFPVLLLLGGCERERLLPGSKSEKLLPGLKSEKLLPEPKTPRQLEKISLPAVTSAEFEVVDPLEPLIRKALADRDYAAIERKVAELLADQTNGQKAYELYRLYRLFFPLAADSDRKTIEARLGEWIAKSPRSHAPLVARGEFRISLAWKARGGGWARELSDEQRRGFRTLLTQAQNDLESARKLNPKDPNAAVFVLDVDLGFGRSRETMEEHYSQAIALAPGHFGARLKKLAYLKPKWYGSDQEMLEFAYQCSREADRYPYAGMILPEALREMNNYPTAGLVSPGNDKGQLLKYEETWREVEREFDRYFTRYPDDLAQRFRYFDIAYDARQWDAAVEQAEKIGNRFVRWSDETLEDYKQRAAGVYVYYAYYGKEPADRAQFYYARAAALNPNDAEPHFYYAMALTSLRKYPEAARAYERVLELKPGHTAAYTGLISVHSATPEGCRKVEELVNRSRDLKFESNNERVVRDAVARCHAYSRG